MSKDKNIVNKIVMFSVIVALVYIGISGTKGTKASYIVDSCNNGYEDAGGFCCPLGYTGTSEGEGFGVCISDTTGETIAGIETCTLEYDDDDTLISSDCIENEVDQYLKFDTSLKVDEVNRIINVPVNTTVNDFLEKIDTNASLLWPVYDTNYDLIEDNVKLMTGALFTITINSQPLTYKIGVNGDVDGDRGISNEDIIVVSKYIIGSNNLEGVYLEAADYDDDDEININDIIKMNRYFKNNNNE